MGFYYNVNQRSINGGQGLLNLLLTLIAAGWNCLGSGDGTGGNYSSSGNLFTSGNHVAFGTYNTGSWFRIQQPKADPVTGQRREFVFQNGATANGLTIRIKYSANVTGSSGGFTGGSPSASRVPSAADEVVVAGGGTDASPTYQGWGNSDYQWAFHVVADNDGDDGWSWWCSATANTSGTPNGMVFMIDAMRAGTAQTADQDPCVLYFDTITANAWGNNLRSANGNNQAFVGGIGTPPSGPGSGTNSPFWNTKIILQSEANTFPGGSGSDNWSKQDSAILCHWAIGTYTGPPYVQKGTSSLIKYLAATRGHGDVFQLIPGSGGDHTYLEGSLLPWPPNTPCFVS